MFITTNPKIRDATSVEDCLATFQSEIPVCDTLMTNRYVRADLISKLTIHVQFPCIYPEPRESEQLPK